MSVILNEALKKEYQELYDSCVINPARTELVSKIVDKILVNKSRYDVVSEKLKIPWQFIGVIHNMEASLNFKSHLHNGDALSGRTIHVPAGRPLTGEPPFTWEDSAIDALTLRRIDQWEDWSIEGMLYQIEGYNGWGYRLHHPEVVTPYLWSFSNHYVKGKYVADGRWSDDAESNQCGAGVLLKKIS
jgi:lysozyme family protein